MSDTKHTPTPYKCGRGIGGMDYLIQAELPCINGLRAWFTVARVEIPDEHEQGYTEGLLSESSASATADFIVTACNAYNHLRAQRDTLLAALREIEAHHVEQNAIVGHDDSRSKTLRIVRDAISAVEASS